eukprot:8531667-Pyramimonas_sp.AAC.1
MFSALEKGCIHAVCCGAVWPLARALAAGYLVDDVRPRCGLPWDAICRRLWGCSSCEDLRK